MDAGAVAGTVPDELPLLGRKLLDNVEPLVQHAGQKGHIADRVDPAVVRVGLDLAGDAAVGERGLQPVGGLGQEGSHLLLDLEAAVLAQRVQHVDCPGIHIDPDGEPVQVGLVVGHQQVREGRLGGSKPILESAVRHSPEYARLVNSVDDIFKDDHVETGEPAFPLEHTQVMDADREWLELVNLVGHGLPVGGDSAACQMGRQLVR